MCYNVHVRATPMVMSHNLVVETHFMTQFEHSSSYVFLCAGTVLYFLRFLLHVFTGPCSFDDLNTIDREACQQSGLLGNDRHHNEAQTEADVARSPSALRSLFAVILAMYEPSDSF